MKQLNRTDFRILEVLSDGKRNIAANVAIEIDADRGYVNTRFGYLLEHGLVERVGPKESSGLYEITTKGHVVLQHQDRYHRDALNDFEAFVEQQTQ